MIFINNRGRSNEFVCIGAAVTLAFYDYGRALCLKYSRNLAAFPEWSHPAHTISLVKAVLRKKMLPSL
jgi:hypothetical protein